MKKLLLVAAISVMLVGCNSSHTALSQTSSNANAAASNAVQSIASVEKQLPDWIKDDTVTSPLEAIVMGGILTMQFLFVSHMIVPAIL
ncbi:hypothetical protein [Photobacterium kishitanii]|uniref:hypothetical protein n=1 Tax=Photobacterium kishitanii TaxID=318456 RepID=UPI00273834C2|nr:hypothetical protein [Photobacterium kishitanii]